MNRKKNQEDVKNINVTIRMTSASISKLDAIADCSGLSRANVIRELVKASVTCDHLKKD